MGEISIDFGKILDALLINSLRLSDDPDSKRAAKILLVFQKHNIRPNEAIKIMMETIATLKEDQQEDQ